MDDEMLRLECLKMAGGDTEIAEHMFSFIKRRGPFSGSQYDRAMAAAEKVKADKAKAEVVGRDGDIPKFQDYLKD